MSNVKTVIKLEHPSKGSRKESILTDEMLVAFCESRIEWLKEDVKDALAETELYHQKAKRRISMLVSSAPELVASPYELIGFQLPYGYRRTMYQRKLGIGYLNPEFYLNLRNQEKTHWGRSEFTVSIQLKEESWKNGDYYLDPDNARISYKGDCTPDEMKRWIGIYNWLYDSEAFFERFVTACETEQSDYFSFVRKQDNRIQRNWEEVNLMNWKKILASKRALQSRALDVIEFGYEGEELKLFKKVDRPIMVQELEVLRVTASKKSVDVRITGRDFVKYEYGYHGIWRTGTVYSETKEWIETGIRIATLFEMDIIQDYSEEKCLYDPSVVYPSRLG